MANILDDEMCEDDQEAFAESLHRVKAAGHGYVKVIVENHHIQFIQEMTSFAPKISKCAKKVASV